ncbi:MAG: hypothetical protein AB3X44_10225, partial [Leptothrix sp. (in: b-proteobacteria)]
MSNNLSIPEPFPDPVPSMAKIGTGVNLLRVRNAEAASGDRQKVRECKEARGQLDTMMEQLRTYAELEAQGEQAICAGLISPDTSIGGIHLDEEHEQERTKDLQGGVQAASRADDSR